MEYIAAAGNTEVPAFLALRAAGFTLSTARVDDGVLWTARKGDLTLVGDSPLQLLGLHGLRKERGLAWKASDVEIDAFLKQFPQA
jgi:hypothetical protein